MALDSPNPELNYYPNTEDTVANQPVSASSSPDNPQPNTAASPIAGSNIIPTGGSTIMNGGSLQSPNYSKGDSGWCIFADGSVEFGNGNFRGDITGATGNFSGSITGASLNIPDLVTANSFHVDALGNAWWGATTLGAATAKILNTGAASFTNITATGGTFNGSGLSFQDSYGDGSDSDVTLGAGTTTLSSDVFYNNLTIPNGATLDCAGYRIFGKGILMIDSGGSIIRIGNDATNGTNATTTVGGAGTKGTGGAPLPDGSIKGSLGGVDGKDGVTGVNTTGSASSNGVNGTTGNAGTSVVKSMNLSGINGSAGGHGGNGGGGGSGGNTGSGGGTGTVTGTLYNKIRNATAAYNMFDIYPEVAGVPTLYAIKAAPSNGGAGSGASGGCASSAGGDSAATGSTGGSGGSGGNGGIIVIFFKSIINNGSISVKGGNGGNAGTTFISQVAGTNAAAGGSGGSAGGNGGNGGLIVYVTTSYSGSGTLVVTGGNAGTGAAAGTKASVGAFTSTTGVAGANGSSGNVGVIVALTI